MAFLLLMPSYNQARFIVEAVQSILNQDDPDWELWIVDNSSDRTPEVMRRFDDSRIRFHHIPKRMDPGSCLNWMLERATGECFSYVHTDNNLHPSYVRKMRSALAEDELALAYCDMRVIDETGNPERLFRRGKFDLCRLLSVDPLGVPFAATTALATKVGGFSVNDTADDVFFCASAGGMAKYIYLPEPLIDYRVHTNSRTEQSGGKMEAAFLSMSARLRPTLEARGLRPRDVLADAIADALDEFDWYVEDLCYRKMRTAGTWLENRPTAAALFFGGLLPLSEFAARGVAPPVAHIPGLTASRWKLLLLRLQFRRKRRDMRKLLSNARKVLLPWALMTLDVTPERKLRFRITSLDFRTLWAARQFERSLGWTPLVDAALEPPGWLDWERADGSEPALDCSERPILST